MKSIFFAFLMLVGCATSNPEPLVVPPSAPQRPAQLQHVKYTSGDCAVFNEAKANAKGKHTDGTIMFILGYMRGDPRVNAPFKYAIIMKHPKMDEPTKFTAVIKVFDEDTDKVPCPK